MDLYTMTPNFLPDQPVNVFTSAIWTERFFTSGEVQIVVPAIPEMTELLAEGTFLGLRGSREVMILQTHDVKDGLLTVTGDTLVKFLDERMAWFQDPEESGQTKEYEQTADAGTVLIEVLNRSVIDPEGWFGGGLNLDWDRDKIENLELGEMDTGGDAWPRSFSVGPLYSGLESFVKKEGMGFRIYLESANDEGYVLKFMAYRGRDRTSGQDVNPLIRLSPHTDSLTDLKDVRSISEYKNVVYVLYAEQLYTFYAEPTLDIPEGFNRRVMVEEPSGEPEDFGELDEWLAQKAKDAFANNNYIRAIDGQASLLMPYKYQRDYRLGDILELEGATGNLAKARVTEYIRAHDSLGHREYPTISVVDPLNTGNWPALNTDPDDDEQWDSDPDFDFDFFDEMDFGDDGTYPESPYGAGEAPAPESPYPEPTNPDPDPDPDPPHPDDVPDLPSGLQLVQSIWPYTWDEGASSHSTSTPYDDAYFNKTDSYQTGWPGAIFKDGDATHAFVSASLNFKLTDGGDDVIGGNPSDFDDLTGAVMRFKLGHITNEYDPPEWAPWFYGSLEFQELDYSDGVNFYIGINEPQASRSFYWYHPSYFWAPPAQPLIPAVEGVPGPDGYILRMQWDLMHQFDDADLDLSPDEPSFSSGRVYFQDPTVGVGESEWKALTFNYDELRVPILVLRSKYDED